tara:strand:+ start:10296 stop:10796 length:501 start_codon:yes stop_codon:yes gene_type:complete
MNKAPFFINAQCEWYYKESKITRYSMVKLFSTILVRDDDDTYHLRTPVEDVLVEVKDVPYMITEMFVTNKRNFSYICFKTNVDFSFILGRKNPLWLEKKDNSEELIPYVLVKKGLIAKVSRSVYYQLVELLEVKKINNTLYNGLYSGKEFFVLDKPDSRHKYLLLD